MKKTVTIFIVLVLIFAMGWQSIVVADDFTEPSVWGPWGVLGGIHNNDVITITDKALGGISVPADTEITIVGNVMSDAREIGIEIAPGGKVKWGAVYCGKQTLIRLRGGGEFEIIEGALIENTSSSIDTIVAYGGTIVVSGGTIRTIGQIGSSIYDAIGDVAVTVDGGTVEAIGYNGATICAGNVVVNDGMVSATGKMRMAIYAPSTFYARPQEIDPAYGNVTVNDGTITSASFRAIMGNSTVKVNGGIVSSSASAYSTIFGGSNDIGGVTITGGAVINTIGDTISSNNISILGGVVSAGTGQAIKAGGGGASKATAKMKGGFVFARGGSLTDVVDTKSVKLTSSSGSGIICSWNTKKGKGIFTKGSKKELKVYTSGASATWSRKGSQSGIRYKKGKNNGFVRVRGASVAPPAPKKTQFKYDLTAQTYNGSRLGINVTPKEGVGKVKAIYYEGTKDTKYKRTTKKPINVGSYKVTIDVAKGTSYKAAKNLLLGIFRIE